MKNEKNISYNTEWLFFFRSDGVPKLEINIDSYPSYCCDVMYVLLCACSNRNLS